MADAHDAAPAAPKKKSKRLLLIVVGVVFAALGAAFPMVIDVPALMGKTKDADGDKKKAAKKHGADEKSVTVPFGDAVVNLAEDRMTRYLRVKILLLTDEEHEKELTEKLTRHKPALKSWLLSHLSGKTLKDVSGSAGINRAQRELFEKFEDVMYPDGHGALKGVLFEEYVVQ